MIYKNLQKSNLENKAVVIHKDYKKCLQKLSDENIKFDLIYIDPPYKLDIAVDSIKNIRFKFATYGRNNNNRDWW